MFGGSPLLRWSYVAVGGIGIAFYLYRELLARRLQGLKDYQVESVVPLGGGLTEVTLKPLGPRIVFAPGQFALIYIETKEGWKRHPFSIASGSSEENLRGSAEGTATCRRPAATEARQREDPPSAFFGTPVEGSYVVSRSHGPNRGSIMVIGDPIGRSLFCL